MASKDDTKTYLSKREIPQLFEVSLGKRNFTRKVVIFIYAQFPDNKSRLHYYGTASWSTDQWL